MPRVRVMSGLCRAWRVVQRRGRGGAARDQAAARAQPRQRHLVAGRVQRGASGELANCSSAPHASCGSLKAAVCLEPPSTRYGRSSLARKSWAARPRPAPVLGGERAKHSARVTTWRVSVRRVTHTAGFGNSPRVRACVRHSRSRGCDQEAHRVHAAGQPHQDVRPTRDGRWS